MKLFLTSYLAGTKELVQNFLTKNNVQEILFIPTAANIEEYRDYVDEGIAMLKETGYSVNILDITTTPHSESVYAIKNCTCLCISGGNTFYLLQELKRNGLVDLIKQKVQDGMLYKCDFFVADIQIDHLSLAIQQHRISDVALWRGRCNNFRLCGRIAFLRGGSRGFCIATTGC